MGIRLSFYYGLFMSSFIICLEANISIPCFNIDESNILYAQDARYPFKRYDDPKRKEGIIQSRKLVSGEEKLDLISAYIENDESKPPGGASWYHLAFFVPETSQIRVVVQEPKNSYVMEPAQKVYPSGTFKFSWPSKIVDYYEIALTDLLPLAKVATSGDRRIVPLVLFYQKPQDPELRFNFCFIPYTAVSLIEYNIYESETLELIYSDSLSNLPANDKVCLFWNGKNQENEKVKSSLYQITMEATFAPKLGTLAKKVNSTYEFYLYNDLLTILP